MEHDGRRRVTASGRRRRGTLTVAATLVALAGIGVGACGSAGSGTTDSGAQAGPAPAAASAPPTGAAQFTGSWDGTFTCGLDTVSVLLMIQATAAGPATATASYLDINVTNGSGSDLTSESALSGAWTTRPARDSINLAAPSSAHLPAYAPTQFGLSVTPSGQLRQLVGVVVTGNCTVINFSLTDVGSLSP